MKMDMVKPMPPKKPTPISCFQFISSGSLQTPNITASRLKRNIPKGLPRKSPKKIPQLFGVSILPVNEPWSTIAVLAKANMGKIMKDTGLFM